MYLNKTVLHVNILWKIIHGSHMDWKNGKTFSSQGIFNRLEKSGKFTQNAGKMREI